MNNEKNAENIEIGWREWVSLPELNVPAIKAKIDTGAKTSSIHAFYLEPYKVGNIDYIKFKIHPLQKKKEIVIECNSPILDKRMVKDSGGHSEERFVISTPIKLGDLIIPAEITLTNREDMQFRMLLGRTTLNKFNINVNPKASYKLGRQLRKTYRTQIKRQKER